MPFTIIRDDISRVPADAVVNAANTRLQYGSGVCGAIFEGAGVRDMQAACGAIGSCPTGRAVITPGFRLPARYVIHTAGPVWSGGRCGEEELLRGCYRNSLALALEYGLKSIAFPLISAGIYGYPKKEALEVAVSEFRSFLEGQEMDIYLVLYDRKAMDIGNRLKSSVRKYINGHYVAEQALLSSPARPPVPLMNSFSREEEGPAVLKEDPAGYRDRRTLKELLARRNETFSRMLLRLIDDKGLTDVQVYKKANIDRKLFSKIRSSESYAPSKRTALSLAIALELSLDEARDLLMRAGYALSCSNRQDVIVEYFLRAGEYDIFTINETLFAFGEPTL